jgi:transposase
LRGCTGQRIHPRDVSDDRLAAVLAALSEDDRWSTFEGALPRQRRRVYDLQPERVRLDSTTASGYWAVTEDGLFPFGPSQDHRPDLPQVQVMLAARDLLGLPVATDVLPGQRADAPLYVPAIKRVRENLVRRGLLYVGDGKMGAVESRAFVQAGTDSYVCPLAEIQLPPGVLESYLIPVWTGQQPLPRITRVAATGQRQHIADGYERLEPLTVAGAGKAITWTERRLVVRSRPLAQAVEVALRARLAKAQAAFNERRRGKKRLAEQGALQEAAETILRQYRVQGRLAVHSTEHVPERQLRRYGSRPATVRAERAVRVTAVLDRRAVAAAIGRMGWRVYTTNTPADQLSLSQAVLAYRNEYLIEQDVGRLKGQPLPLIPMY